ncbi:MAG TPA: hypothetical protein VJZ04_05010 [Lachnospiraceae bacterium]|nr:hypothetical protein [Lachnospiraceae bacterium]
MKRAKEIIVLSIFTIAWWGTFYPDLSLSKDICRVVYVDEVKDNRFMSKEINIFSAKSGQIKVKSRIFEFLKDAF